MAIEILRRSISMVYCRTFLLSGVHACIWIWDLSQKALGLSKVRMRYRSARSYLIEQVNSANPRKQICSCSKYRLPFKCIRDS